VLVNINLKATNVRYTNIRVGNNLDKSAAPIINMSNPYLPLLGSRTLPSASSATVCPSEVTIFPERFNRRRVELELKLLSNGSLMPHERSELNHLNNKFYKLLSTPKEVLVKSEKLSESLSFLKLLVKND